MRIISEPTRTLLDDALIACSSESTRLQTLLAEAARLQAEDRLDATLHAIAIADRGQYLEGLNSVWIEERRDRLGQMVADARLQAAGLAFAVGRYADAARLV